MNKRLFVGNLDFDVKDIELEELFKTVGRVVYAEIIRFFDKKSKGFGFVEMATPESAQDAKGKLNGTEFDGRKLIINDARPRTDSKPGERRPGGFEKRGGFHKF